MTKTRTELNREIAEYLATNPPGTAAEIRRSVAEYRAAERLTHEPATRIRPATRTRETSSITGEQALRMPRFEFIAHWLVTLTKNRKNRGRLGMRVTRNASGEYRVLHGAARTVVYTTMDPDMLYEYARRTELGTQTRTADRFREDAFAAGR